MKVLVTGGLGYIGSHTCVELLQNNYEVIVIDNLSNSEISVITRIEKITNKKITFYKGDLLNKFDIQQVFQQNEIDAVLHFAASKSVNESVKNPLKYYKNNISSMVNLLEVMKDFNVKKFIFSSSAAVYGSTAQQPISELVDTQAMNPYGQTKVIGEDFLNDLYISDNEWSIAVLRYFNPIGAHESGLLGEQPNGTPNNLMPLITQVASKKRSLLYVFGNDYNTIDGTGVRDYIHVVDLAKGHVSAVQKLFSTHGLHTYNLGTGEGYSVLEIINTFEKVNNVDIAYKIVDRRAGDPPICFANPTKAKEELGWSAERTLEDMCRDSWQWEKTLENIILPN
ncbi:UDP-glucose 4-epimerase GalE [Tetragenococcus halophilus]|uniref:UDP-glucose 4-epimerase GalE n=1 Tax=Tetragenococcus halophilus TaxID=51669 RepID=UPI002402F751|nr:UDP-glucose 4-epimerase GalE [Tetragenococcus halophilus]GLL52294.1 UDP-glucose 4-epimerase [Tetragenococcus halophilus]